MSAYQGLTLAIICSIVGIVFGGLWAKQVTSQPDGNDRMREIAAAIEQGARAYLKRQYTTISIVGAVLFLVIGFTPALGWMTAIAFDMVFTFQ